MKTLCETDQFVFPAPDEILNRGPETCPVDWARKIARTASSESCGRCVMCREGTLQILTILDDIVSGAGESDDLELVLDLCSVIQETASCDQAREAANLIQLSLGHYREEWENHLRRRRCSANVCVAYTTIAILPDRCQGCGSCVSLCPEEAIVGAEGLIHMVLQDSCTKCYRCISVCPHQAIGKFGAVLPRLPSEPIPVGSFEATSGRRRRHERSVSVQE